MPRFKIHVRQYVEEVAYIYVEAETPEAAIAKASEGDLRDLCDDANTWANGGDALDAEIYSVLDADGNEVWAR
jgi:hypothetical protein